MLTKSGARKFTRRRLASVTMCAVVAMAFAPDAVAEATTSSGGARPLGGHPHQVVTWGAAADGTTGSVENQTVRDIVHTSVAGQNVRVSLSNAFGTEPVTFDSVYLGASSGGADVNPGSNQKVTFAGQASITVPAGAHVLSDPLQEDLAAGQEMAISVHATGAPGTVTGHNVANQLSYIASSGDHAAEESGTAFTSVTSHWYWADGIVVDEPQQVDTVATLGDSITDGNHSTRGANHRWPDFLAKRMMAQPVPHQFGVMNKGISANKVLVDGAGQSAKNRFARDVLTQPGVKTVVVLEGINDIRHRDATKPEDLIAAYQELITRAHAAGMCVVGGTLTPWEGGSLYSTDRNKVRTGVNDWIRHSGAFDAVVDFDKATRDPQDPDRFLPAYDSGDHLHPSDAGYEAMAATVTLRDLECHRNA